MIGLNHAATGIAIALIVKRPEIAIPLSFMSHFVLDMMPHSTMPLHRPRIFRQYLICEAIAMTTLTLLCMYAFPQQWFLIGTCAVVAFFPDMLWPFYFGGHLRDTWGFRWFYGFHRWVQWSETYRGWLVDILYFSVLVIFFTHH